MAERALLQKHIERILLLSENFTGDTLNLENQTIECTRQKPHAKLGEHYIPNYYKNDDNFTKSWNAHSMFDVSRFIGYSSPGLYDFLFKSNSNFPKTMESTDLLVVDGYDNQNVDTVKAAIENYIKENGLAIEVETIEFKANAISQERMAKIKKIFQSQSRLNSVKGWEQALDDIVAKKGLDPNKALEMYSAVRSMINKWNSLIYLISKKDERNHLKALRSYLELYTNIPSCKNIQMIGGCPYNGKLSLLYASGDKKRVMLIAGSANQLTDSAFNALQKEQKEQKDALEKVKKEIEAIKTPK